MYKLVILFLPSFISPGVFTEGWQKFLGLAEQMPGLQKEAVCEVEQIIVGAPNLRFKKIHEFYFNSRRELDAALESEPGQKAGQWLHQFTQGQFVLMIVEHKEATPDQFKKTEKPPAS